jgi:glyoxylase-like metal-dependent hydrolase (beta-lactamase superfamily II)
MGVWSGFSASRRAPTSLVSTSGTIAALLARMMPHVQAFYDDETYTVTYLVSDPVSKDAVIIDPVLNYDVFGSETRAEQAEVLLSTLSTQGLRLRAILETHAHADHLSAAQYLKAKTGAPVAMGRGISIVQETFRPIFNLPESVPTDGSQFDLLVEPRVPLEFGSLTVMPLPTPGHTPACLSYVVGDAVFTGDALFMEDYGTGRTDFPKGSADALYHSVHDVLYQLPDSTRVFVGHDYQPEGRSVRFESTIGLQKERNIQLRASTTRDEFIRVRNERDKTLRPPRLIYQSVQVNVFGGLLPQAESGELRFLKIPLNRRSPTDASGVPLTESRKKPSV